jgi:protein-tyrosine phosphatase
VTADAIEERARVVALEGGRNFRDMGGYEAQDGRKLKWGKLYRSGSMGDLTPAAYAQLTALGVRFICDLRTQPEREAHPVDVSLLPHSNYWTRDYDLSFGDMRHVFTAHGSTAADARLAMINAYKHLAYEQAPAYVELFRAIVGGELPLIFNCSAGKDRTGVAAALILGVLGVSDDVIVEDFLLTNTTLDRRGMTSRPHMVEMNLEVADVLLSVEADYMHTTLATLREAHGSVEGFVRTELGLSEGDIARLKDLLLE